MKEKTSTFQKILIGLSVAFAILGIFAFAGFIPGFESERDEQDNQLAKIYGDVLIWGTIPTVEVLSTFREYNSQEERVDLIYREIGIDDLYSELLESLVSRTGPDLLLIPSEWVERYRDKLKYIPYRPQVEGEVAMSARVYRDTYVEASEIYLFDEGILGFPVTIDPLVLYWNRDIASSNRLAAAPVFWEDVIEATPRLVTTNVDGAIVRSAIALGEYSNVSNAKGIIATLLLQAGVPIVEIDNGKLSANMIGAEGQPGSEAMEFFMQFSNPKSDVYAWNRSLELSRNMFVAGDLAYYIGYASELDVLRGMNPHLNIDVALIPQNRGTEDKTTYAKMYGAHVVTGTRNEASARFAAQQLSSKVFQSILSDESDAPVPPIRRDMVDFYGSDSEIVTFAESALISKTWRDPNPDETESIFGSMIRDIMSDRFSPSRSLSTAETKLDALLKE